MASVLRAGGSLGRGEHLLSSNKRFLLGFAADGSRLSAGYDSMNDWTVYFNLDFSVLTPEQRPVSAVMQPDGNLVMRDVNEVVRWHSGTWGNFRDPRLVIQDDSNIVISDADGQTIWASGDLQGKGAVGPRGEIDSGHPSASRPYKLLPGSSLLPGEQLQAPTEPFTAVMQADGNLVVYRSDVWTALWASGTDGHPGAKAVMQTDGNLVVYEPGGQAVWNSETWGHPGASVHLHDNGNLAVYTADGEALWASGSTWISPLPSPPVVVSWSPGRQDVFQQGTDGSLLHQWYANGQWHQWEALGGALRGQPGAASWGEGRLDVFHRGEDDALWHMWYDDANGWSDWRSLGGDLRGPPVAAAWGSGRVDVFAEGIDGNLRHISFDGAWNPWESLGGSLTAPPAVASRGSGLLDVAARSVDNACWHLSYDQTGWSRWQSLGGELSFTHAPTAIAYDGRIDVYHLGMDASIYRKTLHAGARSDWEEVMSLREQSLDWAIPTTSAPGLMGAKDCDKQYADCCQEADDIEDWAPRQAMFTFCELQQAACYTGKFLKTAVEWVAGVMESVLVWLGANPGVVIGVILVAAVVVCIVYPPAGIPLLTLIVL